MESDYIFVENLPHFIFATFFDGDDLFQQFNITFYVKWIIGK